jgi:outer membrane protein assembly factor BamA
MKKIRLWIGTSIVVAAIGASTLVTARLCAQEIQAATPAITYEGQKVTSVQLAGQPDGNLKMLRSLIAQPINAPYSQAKVDQTVAALKQAGFQNVEVQVSPSAEGLQVIFVPQPAYYFGVFSFPKAEKTFTYTRLLQAANYSKQQPYSQESVEEAESSLLEFFHRTGYFTATVEPKLQIDKAHGVVNVIYDINLKRRSKFGNLKITGVTA